MATPDAQRLLPLGHMFDIDDRQVPLPDLPLVDIAGIFKAHYQLGTIGLSSHRRPCSRSWFLLRKCPGGALATKTKIVKI